MLAHFLGKPGTFRALDTLIKSTYRFESSTSERMQYLFQALGLGVQAS